MDYKQGEKSNDWTGTFFLALYLINLIKKNSVD